MKASVILLSLVISTVCGPAKAWYSVDEHQVVEDLEDLFSQNFTADYQAANEGSGTPESVEHLIEMLAKYKQPHEQAELELTLAMIYNQRTGLVNPAKAAEHFANALGFELPTTVQVRVYSHRGGSYEQLGQKEGALQDYLRGLQVSLRYTLPSAMPKPVGVMAYDVRGPPDSPLVIEIRERHRQQMERSKRVRFERDMLITRYFLIEGVRRIAKGEIGEIRKAAETVATDEEEVQELVQLATSPNPRPWK